MLKVAICDDSESIRDKLVAMVNNVFISNNINGEVVYDCGNPDTFYSFITKDKVDVIFLDIDLKSMTNGLDLAKKIRETNKSVNIVFITAHLEYVLMAYKFKTFDYLVKPISQEKMEECILRLVRYVSSDSLDTIKIKSGASTYLVKKNEIIYIEKSHAKAFLYTTNEVIENNINLEEYGKILPPNFIRCHKSFIVNLNKITKTDYLTSEIYLINGYKCYIGRKFKKNLVSALDRK